MSGPSEPGWWEGHPELLPPDPELEALHQREYLVRAWKIDDSSMLIRGAVMDLRPGADFAGRITALGGSDDGHPMTIHHMVVDITVDYPGLVISNVDVRFETHPQLTCPTISSRYRDLMGVSISRGFTHKVRELFGGPRGCTHTTALLQAMGPVAVQCVFSMRRPTAGRSGAWRDGGAANAFMRDTCHAWAEEGDLWQSISLGRMPPMPLSMENRLRRAGLDPALVDLRLPDEG